MVANDRLYVKCNGCGDEFYLMRAPVGGGMCAVDEDIMAQFPTWLDKHVVCGEDASPISFQPLPFRFVAESDEDEQEKAGDA